MAEHKFKTGQMVTISATDRKGSERGGFGKTPRGTYQIVRPLPAQDGQNQYRIKSNLDGHERVVKEHELT